MEPIIEFQNFSFKYRSQKEPTLKRHQSRNLSGGEGTDRRTVRFRKVDISALHQRACAVFLCRRHHGDLPH